MEEKKGVIYTVIVVLAVAFVWNLTKIDLSKIDISNQQEYILKDVYIDAQDLVNGYKGTNDCEYIYLNEDDDIVVILTEEQRQQWMDQDRIENTTFPIGNIGPAFSYLENYTKMKVKGAREEILYCEELTRLYVFDAEIMQVLSGEQDWKLTVTLIDTDTDTVLHTFNLPKEELDWDELNEG